MVSHPQFKPNIYRSKDTQEFCYYILFYLKDLSKEFSNVVMFKQNNATHVFA